MINYKDLSLDQALALYHMAKFNCDGIDCEDCPLRHGDKLCGSVVAELIINQYNKETRQ